jgi:serine/threonine-protein kinase
VEPSRYPETPVGTGGWVGAYRLGEPLGSGGMAVVFEAERKDGEPVAVKILRREWLANETVLRRFRVEGITGYLVRHPKVAAVLERGESRGVPFLVMERVGGEPLGLVVARDGPQPPARAVAIVKQVLAGLDAVHGLRIVHGDVKSDNVMVDVQGDGSESVKLIDFGLAQMPYMYSPWQHGHHPIAGTPEYMAPEVLRGHGLSYTSDVYGAGVILYELLTGTTPFAGGTPADVVHRKLAEAALPSVQAQGWTIPAALEQIAMRALQQDRRKRFPSVTAFALALERVGL